MTSIKNKGFDQKTHIRRIPQGEFFDNWHMDRLFFSLAGRKKIIKFYTYINVIRVQNENCEFLQNLCTDFLAALSVETHWMFNLCPLKQRKFSE